jgi:putative RecB family exonuclease
MAVSGKPTFPYDLSEWPRNRIADEFGKLEENIKAENFEPHPTVDGCKMCSVNWMCEYAVAENF